MSLNVEKMRRAQARRTPDAVWMSFDVFELNENQYFNAYHAFVKQFGRMMEIKHGKKLKGISAYRSEMNEPSIVRVQLVAKVNS